MLLVLLTAGVGGWHEHWLSWRRTTSRGRYVLHQHGLPRAGQVGVFSRRHSREGTVDSFSEIND